MAWGMDLLWLLLLILIVLGIAALARYVFGRHDGSGTRICLWPFSDDGLTRSAGTGSIGHGAGWP